MYDKCYEIAKKAHEGQKRWGSGLPYITHPEVVASKFIDEKLKCIAILHDVLEDSEIPAQDLLKEGVDVNIIVVVEILTRKKDESYKDYILRVMEDVDATKIKIEDIKHNLLDLKQGSLRDKYELALILLHLKRL